MAELISIQDAQYALDIVKAICTQVGPGLPGSPQEWERAAMIKKELESHLGVENVASEAFTLVPWAFQGVLRISALFTLIATLLNISMGRIADLPGWLTALTSLACATLSVLPLFFETIRYQEFIDPLFKKKQSVNVIGRLRRSGTENVKRVLIISGHHDSALEFTWLRLLHSAIRWGSPDGRPNSARQNGWILFLGYVFLVLTVTMFLGPVFMLVMSIIQLAGIIAGNSGIVHIGTLGWVWLAYPIVPSILFGVFYIRGEKNGGNVPGAADNLSASALVVAMCRFLVQNPACIPADTEIRFISFGSEEAGIRGSRRYVERHLDELKRLDARLLNYEVVAHPQIDILGTDVRGVKNSPEMVNSVAAAAQRAGVPYTVKNNPTSGGGSDAGPFSQAGLKATTLMPIKMPHQMLAFYHQKWDRPEVLTYEPLINVLKLTLEWIRNGAGVEN
ncbi:MAG: ywaD 6 [Chloroflexi bacterium]|nr:ywaD 6 [Chloroflexota bacterium]